MQSLIMKIKKDGALFLFFCALFYFPVQTWAVSASSASTESIQSSSQQEITKEHVGNIATPNLAMNKPKVCAGGSESCGSERAPGFLSSEWSIVWVTLLLSLITLGLAIYTAKLYRATVALGSEAKETSTQQAADMAASIAQAAKAAVAMEAVAETSGRQMAMIGMQVDEAIKLNAINRQNFFAEHQPKIILRDATTEQDMGNLISVSFVISNIGSTGAKIICAKIDVRVFEGAQFDADILPEIDWNGSDVAVTTLLAGEQINLKFVSPNLRWNSANKTCHVFLEPEYGLFFLGQIVYEDMIGTQRRAGFRRKYYTQQNRFLRAVDDKTHFEY